MKPETTYSIEQFIVSCSEIQINYDKLSLIEQDNPNRTDYNILNDYIDELQEASVTIVMTQEEYLKYSYKPKLLAHDVYGSCELFFIILLINDMCSMKEFNRKKIKMFKPDVLNKYLSAIYNAEYDTLFLNKNKSE